MDVVAMRVPRSGPAQINSVWPDKWNAPVLLTSWTWRPTSAGINDLARHRFA
jgi:hypothetical protein